MDVLARFDAASQQRLQSFVRKVSLFAAFALFVSVMQTRGIVLAGGILQVQCLIGAALSVVIAAFHQHRVDAPFLTYWDEATAFLCVGILIHIAMTLI